MSRPSTPIVLVVAALLAAGCSGGTITGPRSVARSGDYSPAERIRVMLAAPGSAGEPASRAVSQRILAVLQQTHGDVGLIPTSNEQDALAAAREAKAAYLISPTILEWTDGHAPPFTADRIKVQLDLRDPGSGEVVSTVTFANVSPFLSAVDSGPETLLDSTFDRAVTMLVTTGAGGHASARRPGPAVLEHVPGGSAEVSAAVSGAQRWKT
jgi:hypothetical protein